MATVESLQTSIRLQSPEEQIATMKRTRLNRRTVKLKKTKAKKISTKKRKIKVVKATNAEVVALMSPEQKAMLLKSLLEG